MKKTLLSLKQEAGRIAKQRNHVLVWESYSLGNGEAAVGKCKTCEREVQVLTHPFPNEIDIAGEVVALDCEETYEN